MKKKLFILFLIPIICISIVIGFNTLKSCILSKNFKEENLTVFIPKGVANKYEDPMFWSFEDRRIWTYSLNKRERNLLNKEIDNKPWLKLEPDLLRKAKSFFTVGLDDYWPEKISDTLYYCLYDMKSDEFVELSSNAVHIGWYRLLFIYDVVNYKYYCVSMSI